MTTATEVGLKQRRLEQLEQRPARIYMNGAMVPYADATIHVSSVAAKYGANVFEGLCAYAGDAGRSFVFRLREHLVRLRHSTRVMQIDSPWREADYQDAVLVSLRDNRIHGDAHIRLSVLVTGEGGCDGTGPASLVCVAAARSPQPLERRAVHAATTTWRRIDDGTMPPRIKAGANYQNGRFGLLEARRNGYDEAIFLTQGGAVAEGATACFFMVRNGTLVTPPVTASILESVTRATLLDLAAGLGIPVDVRQVDRTELYMADEAFFCGSGHEVRPVLSVDRFAVGDGCVGPLTRTLWDAYNATVRGRVAARAGWLTAV